MADSGRYGAPDPPEEPDALADANGLGCCPEWCDEAEGKTADQHGSVCPEAPMDVTRGQEDSDG